MHIHRIMVCFYVNFIQGSISNRLAWRTEPHYGAASLNSGMLRTEDRQITGKCLLDKLLPVSVILHPALALPVASASQLRCIVIEYQLELLSIIYLVSVLWTLYHQRSDWLARDLRHVLDMLPGWGSWRSSSCRAAWWWPAGCRTPGSAAPRTSGSGDYMQW